LWRHVKKARKAGNSASPKHEKKVPQRRLTRLQGRKRRGGGGIKQKKKRDGPKGKEITLLKAIFKQSKKKERNA